MRIGKIADRNLGLSRNVPTGRPVRQRIKGMGIGCLLLALFGGLWLGLTLAGAPLPVLVPAVALPTLILVVLAIGVLRDGVRRIATEPPPAPEQRLAGRRVGQTFGLIFGAEGVLIAVVANLLARSHRQAYIPAAVGIIVGLHFLPLARVFHYSLYTKTGLAGIIACLITGWLARAHANAAGIATGGAMALILWITASIVLADARRLLAATRLRP